MCARGFLRGAVTAVALAVAPSSGGLANGGVPTGFTPLGDLPGGLVRSAANDVSADGTIVVGESASTNGPEGFRWTAGGGMEGLGDLAGGAFSSSAYAISGDGTVIVGSSQSTFSAPAHEAFRWTAGGGLQPLGSLPGGLDASSARGASYDGSVIIGTSVSGLSILDAMYWTSGGGMNSLGDLTGGAYSSDAFDISNDGSIIVGRGRSSDGDEGARWVGLVPFPIGDIPTGNFGSNALACDADASVLVGIGKSDAGTEAMRWTDATGVVGLGDLPGGTFDSAARGCSADGSVVVGSANDATGVTAFIWTQADGMRALRDVLGQLGVHAMKGWQSTLATAVSADGTVIVGWGVNPAGNEEGWVAVLGDPVVPEGAFLPKALKVRVNERSPERSKLLLTGMIDLGVDAPDLGAGFTVTIGSLVLDVPSLTSAGAGRKWVHRDGATKFTLVPSKYGSSSAAFKLTHKGDLGGGVQEFGLVETSFSGETLTGGARVAVEKRRYGIGKGPGDLHLPTLHLVKAKARVPAGKTHSVKAVTCLAAGGDAPVMPSEVRVEFAAFSETLPDDVFTPRGSKWVYTGDAPGVTKLVLDYAKEQISITIQGVDLGALAGASPVVHVGIAVGAREQVGDVRMGLARSVLRY